MISQTLRRARYEFQSDVKNVVYDSKDATIPTERRLTRSLYSVYKPALETEASLRINPRGEILEAHVPTRSPRPQAVTVYRPRPTEAPSSPMRD